MTLTFNLLLNGFISGLLATMVMTILMMIGMKTGMAPPLQLPLRLGKKLLGNLSPEANKVGLLMHSLIGSLFGLLYTLLLGLNWINFLGTNVFLSGALYALLPWILMQVIALPKLGAGVFGSLVSKKVPVMSLLLHVIYGLVLGYLVNIIPLV
jgi:hypothetical protein